MQVVSLTQLDSFNYRGWERVVAIFARTAKSKQGEIYDNGEIYRDRVLILLRRFVLPLADGIQCGLLKTESRS